MARIILDRPLTPDPRAEIVQPIAIRSAKALSLILVLEALRLSPVELARPKL